MRFAAAALPQPPEHVVVTQLASSSVTLSWNSTVDTDVRLYTVQYRHNGSSDDHVEISVWKPEITVVGLEAQTTYEFHILAVNDAGPSHSASSIVVTTTGHTGLSSLSDDFVDHVE